MLVTVVHPLNWLLLNVNRAFMTTSLPESVPRKRKELLCNQAGPKSAKGELAVTRDRT